MRHRSTASRFALLLWATLLLAAQTAALAHAHADEAPEAGCAACTLVHIETAAVARAPSLTDPAPCRWVPPAVPAIDHSADSWHHGQPRAPPRA